MNEVEPKHDSLEVLNFQCESPCKTNSENSWQAACNITFSEKWFRDTVKAFEDSKNKQKLFELMLCDWWKYVYSESVFNTGNTEIKHKC